MRTVRHLLCTAAIAIALASPAWAQTSGDNKVDAPVAPSRSTSYDSKYFTQYAPRTALDMVSRLPGFSLDLGNTDLRGFSGAAGNVVIDGQRPSSKSETLESALSRIPASNVARIDVGPGDLFGAEYSSKSQVANVILAKGNKGVSGNITVVGTRHWFGRIVPNAAGSIQISRGPSTFNLSLDSNRNDIFERGYDHVIDSTSGVLLEDRHKFNYIYDRNPFAAGSWSLEQGDNKSAHINLRFQPSSFYLLQENHVIPTGDDERDDRLHQDYKTKIFEAGGDITRPVAGGGLKLVVLANRRKRTTYDDYLVQGLGGSPLLGGYVQNTSSRLSESIGKLSWSRSSLAGMNFEAGAEIAYNKLDYALDLFSLEANGDRTKINLPLENATVSELRGEVYVNAGKQLSKALRVDAGLRYEVSRLKVRGDAIADRSLKFLKPSVTIDWQPGADWHTQLIVRRTVAQLDFYDFVSVAELASDRISGGNANLVPQRTWEGRFVAEHPLFGSGKARLELGYDLVQLLQDRVLIYDEDGNAFDSPGNLGTGRRMFASINLDAPLDRVWKGLRMAGNATIQRTRVKDPISGTTRRWSSFFPDWQWYVEARRDAGSWAYGLALSDRATFYEFRTDEIDSHPNSGIYGTAFVEYRPNARSSLALNLEDFTDVGGYNLREFYFPNRTNPDPGINEVRYRNSHVRISLTYKMSFGAQGK